MTTNRLPVMLLILGFCMTCCGKKKSKVGNAQRAAIMSALTLASEAHEMDGKANSAGTMSDDDYQKLIEKHETAHALTLAVDDKFLAWIDPAMPKAFEHFRQAMSLRAKGMRRNDTNLQEQANEHWLHWGDFWQKHDEIVYRKLKVGGTD